MIFDAFYCAFGFKVWKKYNYDLIFFYQKRYQKTQNCMLISNPLKKFLKNSPKINFFTKPVWRTWVKVGKVHIFVTFSLIIFLVHFKKLLQWILNQFCVFWYLSLWFKIFFKGNISTFFKLWSQMRKKRSKKTENLFYKHVLEFSYATINELV